MSHIFGWTRGRIGALALSQGERVDRRRRFSAGAGRVRGFFYCFEHGLAVELDGGLHAQPSQVRREAGKADYLRKLGISLLQIPPGLVLEVPEQLVPEAQGAFKVTMGQRTPR